MSCISVTVSLWGSLSTFFSLYLRIPKHVTQMKYSSDSVHTNEQCSLSKTGSKMMHLFMQGSQDGTTLSLWEGLPCIPELLPVHIRLTPLSGLASLPPYINDSSMSGLGKSEQVSRVFNKEGLAKLSQGRSWMTLEIISSCTFQ